MWVKIAGGLFVLIVLIVLLTPTLLSTSAGRSFVLGKVNADLNGRVEIDDWSFGWMSGTRMTGVRVVDAAGQSIVSLKSLTSDLSVLDIARGNYSLGEAIVDGLEFQIKREADGELNLEKIANEPAAPPAPAPPPADPSKPPAPAPPTPPATKLPNVSGKLIVRNSKGTYEDVVKKQSVQFASIDGTVNIPNINAAIENTLDVVFVPAGGQAGKLKVAGTVDAVEQNELRLEQANVDQSITLDVPEAAAIVAFFPPGGIERMTGATNATVIVKLSAGKPGVVTADLKTTGFSAGSATAGDTYAAKEITVHQEISTSLGGGGAITVVGRADVIDFATTTSAGARFAEPHVVLANNINLDTNAKSVDIADVSLAMESTNAVRASVKGKVGEFDTVRRLDNVTLTLDYDAKTLWDILRPILDPETAGKSLEEFTMTGKRSQKLVVAGTYPADDPNAIQSIRATGAIGLDTLSGKGLDVSQLDLKFALDKGILHIEHPDPLGAICNGGRLSLHGTSVDLSGEHPRLFAPPNHPLIKEVSINPLFASSIIGRFVNPAFEGATQARGLLEVIIVNCTGLALDDAMQSTNPAESGRAELNVALKDFFIGQPELVALVSKLKPNALNESGFSGQLRDGKVIIEGGKVESNLTFQVDKYPVSFGGGIGLAQNQLINFGVNLPQELFAAIDDKLADQVPASGYRVALAGTTDNWIQSASKSIVPMLTDLGLKAGIDSLLGGKKDGKPIDPTKPEDVIGGLLDKIGGDKETDAEKEARRAKERQKRAEREAAAKEAGVEPPLTKKEREQLKKEQERAEKERKREEKKNSQ